MKDFSFFRLKNSFREANVLGDSPVTDIFYNDFIQLSPFESYNQITNVKGGISFEGDYRVELVNCSDESLKDITGNVFISEFNDNAGNNQLSIEIVNIGEDFYRETVFLRFTHTISNMVYWSAPLNVTDYQKEQTSYFQYKCYDDFLGIPYTNAQKWQSIRLKTYFDIPIDLSESQDYYQVSRMNTISARTLIKKFERYQIDYINNFCYERLNALLKSDLVYLDGVRITDKPTIESADREAESNFFTTNFTISKNYNDTLDYEFQVFEGLRVVSYFPQGVYTFDRLPNDGVVTFNIPITLNNGSVSLLDVDNTLKAQKFENNMSVLGNVLTIQNIISDGVGVNELGRFHLNITQGLVKGSGIQNDALINNDTWVLKVQRADFDSADFDFNDYLTD